jgi:2-keto-4-pentenoate hydratase
MPDTLTQDAATQAAGLLLAARSDPSRKLADLPAALRPADKAAAYAIQQKVAASFSGIGGWKVGAPGPDGPPQCGALPASGVVPSPATLSAQTHTLRGIEAEVCFRMATDLPPRETPYTRAEVIAAIAAAHPAIEVLESRYLNADAVDPLTNLADTQSHGGFVYGPGTENWQGIDFGHEMVEQFVDGELQMSRTGNPAGDMIRLIVWLADEGAVWAGGLKAGQIVTCGSWTGITEADAGATVTVTFAEFSPVVLRFQSSAP